MPSNLRPREQAILCLSAPLLHPYRLSDEIDVELGRDRRDEGAEYESKRDHCGSENRVRESGYTISGVDYPSTISFDKPAGKLGELMYGSYGTTTTVRVKLSLVPIPGTNDYWLKPSVFRVSDAGEAGFEDSTKMLGLWSGEFKPLLRQIQAQAAGAGPDV